MTIAAILKIVKRFSERYINLNEDFIKPFVLDLSDKKNVEINPETHDSELGGILFCDFYETKNLSKATVKFLKENKDLNITDRNIPVKNFTWWYTCKDNKYIIDKLENLDDDLVVIPVRNLKRLIRKPFNKVYVKNETIYFNNGEVEIEAPYFQKFTNIGKCLLISQDGHSMFIYGVTHETKEELKQVQEFLKEHPAYPVMVDNGRYLFYFVGENISKEEFICGGIHTFEQLTTFGFLK